MFLGIKCAYDNVNRATVRIFFLLQLNLVAVCIIAAATTSLCIGKCLAISYRTIYAHKKTNMVLLLSEALASELLVIRNNVLTLS